MCNHKQIVVLNGAYTIFDRGMIWCKNYVNIDIIIVSTQVLEDRREEIFEYFY